MRSSPETSWVTLTTDFIACDLGEDTVVLSLADGTYYGLNAVGARVWELLQQQPRTVAQLRLAIGREFDVPPNACAADLEAFLTQLHEKQLIRMTDAPAP